MKLTVIEDGVRADLDLDQPVVTIGRALDNDLRLQSSRVSRHHTRLETSDGESWIIDLGSANGTLVNGERVTRRLVDVGDVITIGGVEIAIEPDRPPAAAIAEGGLATLTGEARRERERQ